MSNVAAKMLEWNCNKIFLATEDKTFLPPFKQIFGESCVILDREYLDYDPTEEKPINFCHADRENDHFLLGKEYLTQMVILSKCQNFITARTSGALGVMMMAENFENVLAFNLGRYGQVTPEDFLP